MKPQQHNQNEKLNRILQYLKKDISTPKLTLIDKHSSHQHCMICSASPLLGLKLNFYSDKEQQVWAYYRSSPHQQGYQDILHGGFISALLDGSMCQALFNQGIEAVTADMNIRFVHEIPVYSDILMTAEILSMTPPLYKVQAALYVDNQLMAKSNARFFKKDIGKKSNASTQH